MVTPSATDDGFPVRCEICGQSALVNVSRPPGDAVCPFCGSLLWVAAVAEVTSRYDFVPDVRLPCLESRTRDEALGEIASALMAEFAWTAAQRREFVAATIQREQLGSTGIGRGIAVPHWKFTWLDHCQTALAFAPEGIAWEALDDKPVHTIIALATSASSPGDGLRQLERISRSFRELGA